MTEDEAVNKLNIVYEQYEKDRDWEKGYVEAEKIIGKFLVENGYSKLTLTWAKVLALVGS